MEPVIAYKGSDTAYSSAGNGDLSGVVRDNAAEVAIRVKNISDTPLDFHYRNAGGSGDAVVQIEPGAYSATLWIQINNSLVAMDYWVSQGQVQVEVVWYKT